MRGCSGRRFRGQEPQEAPSFYAALNRPGAETRKWKSEGNCSADFCSGSGGMKTAG